MIFSIKLLCGTIVDITLSDNFYDLSLIDIKTKVFEALSEELSKNITPKHIHLFSFNDDSNLYKDMINGITIGCYIDQFIVEIDFDDNNEYFLENNYENPYERIVFKIITNVVLSRIIMDKICIYTITTISICVLFIYVYKSYCIRVIV